MPSSFLDPADMCWSKILAVDYCATVLALEIDGFLFYLLAFDSWGLSTPLAEFLDIIAGVFLRLEP